MPTRLENLLRIRSGLGSPFPQCPNLHLIVQQEIMEEQDVCNDLNNTGKAWATQTYQLNLNPNQSTYEIQETNFGKPLYVVKEINDPYVQFISVPFTDITDLNYNVVWNDNTISWNGLYGNDITPERMAFYREGFMDSDYKVAVQPMPQSSATYIITYLIGHLGNDDPLSATVAVPEHASLIQLRAQMALLPHAEWYEDQKMNSDKRRELMISYDYQLQRKEQIFDKYKRSLMIPQTHDVEAWDA